MNTDLDHMLTKGEAAHALGVSIKSVERLVSRKLLPIMSMTGTRGAKRIPASAVGAYQRSRMAEVRP